MNSTTIRAKLTDDLLNIPDIRKFIGKNVEIIINEVQDFKSIKPKKKVWHYSGSINLKGAMDNINIRDFAHE